MYKQLKKRGFTLLEVMVVVLIAVLVTMASVPVYKRNQERNRYLAATGVLMELGTAVRLTKEEYPNLSCSFQVTGNANPITVQTQLDKKPTCDNLLAWMRGKNYLSVIPFENQKYKGYSLYINASNHRGIGTNDDCNGHKGYACMSGSNDIDEYKWAWVDIFGTVINEETSDKGYYGSL